MQISWELLVKVSHGLIVVWGRGGDGDGGGEQAAVSFESSIGQKSSYKFRRVVEDLVPNRLLTGRASYLSIMWAFPQGHS